MRFISFLVAILFLAGEHSFGQTFSTDFETYSTNTLYLNGWDFNSAQYFIGTGDSDFSRSLQTANLSTRNTFKVSSGYWLDDGLSDRTISFDWKPTWDGDDDGRRGEWRLLVFDHSDTELGSTLWISNTSSNSVQSSGFTIPAALLPNVDAWYYISIEARRVGTNSSGTSILRFDNFSTSFPTNSFWPELSPNVTVTDLFSVSDAEIDEGDQATITFTFEYDEILASPSQRAIRGLEYQIDLHAGLEYVSHTITGSSAGPGAAYNSGTGVFTIEAIQKDIPLVLTITVEGIADCPACEVEVTALNANDIQPKTGFGDEIEILSVLPIELIYLRAEANQKRAQVEVSWATASEKDNDFFTIERSKDGLRFHEIATVLGAGTHVGRLEYTHTDITPFDGDSYYRLKQTDFDGTFAYSYVVRVNLPFARKDFTIAPIPLAIGDEPSIWLKGDWDANEQVNIQILDTKGSQVWQSTGDVMENELQLKDAFPTLPAGVYVVAVFSNNFRLLKKILIGR